MANFRMPVLRTGNGSNLLFFGRPGIYSAAGAHIAHFFEEEEERLTVLAPFIRTGLTANHQCLLITEPSRFSTLERRLRGVGMDLKSASVSGQLVVCNGLAKVCEMSSIFEETLSRARGAGRKAIRVACDMTRVLGGIAATENQLEWEILYDRYVGPDANLILLCQYDNARSSGAAILCALHVHPLSITDRFIQENPFHLSRPTDSSQKTVTIPRPHEKGGSLIPIASNIGGDWA